MSHVIMTTMILRTMLGILLTAQQGVVDPKYVIDLLESIQPQLQDFRCEFEGTEVVKDEEGQRPLKLKEDKPLQVKQ